MAVQMTCPYCKREFPYNNGKLDAHISKLGQRINEINLEIVKIKQGPKTKATWERRQSLIKELAEIQQKISELKAVRKAGDQQIRQYEYMLLKEAIKDHFGEESYKKILAEVEKELQAYKISGLMWHEYTRSNAKANITSINKIR